MINGRDNFVDKHRGGSSYSHFLIQLSEYLPDHHRFFIIGDDLHVPAG